MSVQYVDGMKLKDKPLIRIGLKISHHDRLLLLSDTNLSMTERSLYLYICEVTAWGKARFTKDHKTIVKELGININTLEKYIRKLRDKGYIYSFNHTLSYGKNKFFRSTFIFPLKYHEELFYKEDMISIIKNVISELENSKELVNKSIVEQIERFKSLLK